MAFEKHFQNIHSSYLIQKFFIQPKILRRFILLIYRGHKFILTTVSMRLVIQLKDFKYGCLTVWLFIILYSNSYILSIEEIYKCNNYFILWLYKKSKFYLKFKW